MSSSECEHHVLADRNPRFFDVHFERGPAARADVERCLLQPRAVHGGLIRARVLPGRSPVPCDDCNRLAKR
jgi:hypothetical protein